MVNRARVYVEGGGRRRELQAKCRRGFRTFFGKAVPPEQVPEIVSCGGRGSTYNRFRSACNHTIATELLVLLVDSEAPVSARSGAWTHLKHHDNWQRPARGNNAHLMVQCMEAWFLADKTNLAAHFGSGFVASAIPADLSVENVSKRDIENGLRNATRNCSRGRYDKGRDSFAILGKLDPQKVTDASPHAARLVRTFRTVTSQ